MSTAFPSYLHMPTRVPRWLWDVGRLASVAGLVALVVALLVEPRWGLRVWWGIVVPCLPLVWLLVPGLWRNLCPAAAVNQVPRRAGLSFSRTAPAWWKNYAPAVGMALFLAAVASRPLIFDDNGPATAAGIGVAFVGALVGGVVLKGKSGWCSSVCPMLPVQRLYGQTPLATVPNSHCRPCVGCTKNCYDFNPKIAWLADVNDEDERWAGLRLIFAGVFPGVVLAYFTSPSGASAVEVYARFLLALAASVGLFMVLRTMRVMSDAKLTALYAAAAIVLFYWWASRVLAGSVFGDPDHFSIWIIRLAAFAFAASFVWRSVRKESVFLTDEAPSTESVRFGGAGALTAIAGAQQETAEVTIEPHGTRILAKLNQPLLEVVEGSGIKLEAGCRMGVCGADPICIVEGMENLSEVSREERGTLDRLGLADTTRMACSARLKGPVTMSIEPDEDSSRRVRRVEDFVCDASVKSVVILGNGIAGITTADHLRRRHPTCSIDVIAAEPYPLYNRMGISRIIYGRSAMSGLTLLPDSWYEDRHITAWLNTRAVRIDREERTVALGTGEVLAYDRLVLATGAQAFVPTLEGYGIPGSFTLRSAGDAFSIREYSQKNGCDRAAVAGGGLLGLEAAVALSKIGLDVTVLERGERLLRRQLDLRAAQLLQAYLEGLGLTVLVNATCLRLLGDGRLERVLLEDGRSVPAEMMLIAAGILPDVRLAQEAGLEVARGVVVDDSMCASDPSIYAVGDAAEFDGKIFGLWPTAVEQAEVAGEVIAGGVRKFAGAVPVAVLKVAGIDVLSCGRIESSGMPGEEIMVHEDRMEKRYTKLVVVDGRLEGAILLGHSVEGVTELSEAVKEHRDMSAELDSLRRGDLSVLS
ncbi:FAD-dependent oxidoreductase [Streptomyces sp. WAC06614]|uniref:FAD-dependent oxidoreductase n=1 Tax=Streptomyces sp. WAC06614 TaxID=2487416 RepID=UPI000F7B104C|nr:FAD-dependent oxidoreductase [Streptomyces sp. WAC06614]RSS83584.1 hypothetical protein EF918_03135 [Streptomyces sp. WAC06614]